MKESLDSNLNKINKENDSSEAKFDIAKENFEEKEKLQIILQDLEKNLDGDLKKEKEKKKEQKEGEEEGKNEESDKKSDIKLHFLEQSKNDNKCYIRGLYSLFVLVLPFFVTINLIGIFQIISVMNALSEVIWRAIWCYLDLEDKDDEEYYEFTHFFSFYYKFSIDEGIEFDLIETMSFLGIIFVKFYGYSIPSVIFGVINIIALALIMNFFSEYTEGFEKYSILQIVYLILCYILLFVGVGSSALLFQQLLIDNYEKYTIFLKEVEVKKKEDRKSQRETDARERGIDLDAIPQAIDGEKNPEEEEEIKEPYFLLICLTSVFGFLGKYLLNILISYKKNSFDEKYDFNVTDTSIPNYNETLREMNIEIFNHDKFLFYFIGAIYVGSIAISILLYKAFKWAVYEGDEEKKQDEDSKKKGIRECNLFGYIIYIKEYDYEYLSLEVDNKKEKIENKIQFINNDNINDDQKVVLIHRDKNTTEIKDDNADNEDLIKDEQEEHLIKNKQSVTEITGGKGKQISIQFQHSSERPKNVAEKTCNCCRNCCESIVLCFKLLSDSFVSCFNEIICNFFCCGKQCCCCCCCCECCSKKEINNREREYDLKNSYFCYCYKSKRHMKWFNRFIRDDTQMKIMPLLMQYIVIQLNTAAFDKIYEENNEEGTNDFNETRNIFEFVMFFIGSIYIFAYSTYSFGNLYDFLSKGKKEEKDKEKNKFGRSTEKLSNEILNGTYGVLIFNGFYSFVLSIFCLYNDIKNNNYFYIPIFINKFYFFTFAHQCTICTEKDDEINYFTVATLLSIYLLIWDRLIDFYKMIPNDVLLYIQIIISTGIILINCYLLFMLFFLIKRCLFTFLYLITFPICGGCWFIPCYINNKLDENESEKCNNEECLNRMFCGGDNLKEIKKRIFAG